MKKAVFICFLVSIVMCFSGLGYAQVNAPEDHRTMIPITDSTYTSGTEARRWLEVNTDELAASLINFGTCTDTGDLTFTVVTSPNIELITGTILAFIASTPNTTGAFDIIYGSTTYSVKSLHNATPAASYVEEGDFVLVGFDGTYFQLLTPDNNP